MSPQVDCIPSTSATSVAPSPGNSVGHQLLLDLGRIEAARLDDIDRLRRTLVEAARSAGATVVEDRFHHFEPHGVSGVVILAESHVAIHTWPELGTAAVDVFTCGDPALTQRVADAIEAALEPGSVNRRRFERGGTPEAGE